MTATCARALVIGAVLWLGACGSAAEDEVPVVAEQALQGSGGDAVTAQACLDQGKVMVCHAPPGRPDKALTLCVGQPAWAAHVRHGDRSEQCLSLPVNGLPPKG